jgi:hypothetical protein
MSSTVTERADAALRSSRATRQRLAGACRQLLLELERHPQPPSGRRPQWEHEQQHLQQALTALLAPAPAVTPRLSQAEREMAKSLEATLQWDK